MYVKKFSGLKNKSDEKFIAIILFFDIFRYNVRLPVSFCKIQINFRVVNKLFIFPIKPQRFTYTIRDI